MTPHAPSRSVLPDQLGGEGDRTVMITLSDPGGCATLGSPATAELTIRDDDRDHPAPAVWSGPDLRHWRQGDDDGVRRRPLGDGAAARRQGRDGRGRSRPSSWPGSTLTAPSTTASAPAAPVTTNIRGELSQEEALGVAIQPDPDGRIVVAGYLRNEVTVACYQPNGQLDETFGTDGVVSGIATVANGVAINPDGGIVLAGRTPRTPRRGRLRRSVRRPALADGQMDGASAWTVWSPTWAG